MIRKFLCFSVLARMVCFAELPDLLETYRADLGSYYDFFKDGLSQIDDGQSKTMIEIGCVGEKDILNACKEGASTYILSEFARDTHSSLYVYEINSHSLAQAKKGYKLLFGEKPEHFFEMEFNQAVENFPHPIDLSYFFVVGPSFKEQYPVLKQVTALLKKISPDGVILIDLRYPPTEKKSLLERYLQARGWTPLAPGQKLIFTHPAS